MFNSSVQEAVCGECVLIFELGSMTVDSGVGVGSYAADWISFVAAGLNRRLDCGGSQLFWF